MGYFQPKILVHGNHWLSSSQLNSDQNPQSWHSIVCTGWFLGMLVSAHYNPSINGLYNPLIPYIQANNQVPLVIAQLPLTTPRNMDHSWVLVVALMTLTEVKVRSTIHQPLREFWERGSWHVAVAIQDRKITPHELEVFFFGAKNDKNWGDGWLLIQIIQDSIFHLFVVHVQQKRLVRLTEICWTVDFCEVDSCLRKPGILYTYDISIYVCIYTYIYIYWYFGTCNIYLQMFVSIGWFRVFTCYRLNSLDIHV